MGFIAILYFFGGVFILKLYNYLVVGIQRVSKNTYKFTANAIYINSVMSYNYNAEL